MSAFHGYPPTHSVYTRTHLTPLTHTLCTLYTHTHTHCVHYTHTHTHTHTLGETGLGKSTLINTLFKSKISRSTCTPPPHPVPRTTEVNSVSHGKLTIACWTLCVCVYSDPMCVYPDPVCVCVCVCVCVQWWRNKEWDSSSRSRTLQALVIISTMTNGKWSIWQGVIQGKGGISPPLAPISPPLFAFRY